MVNRVTLVGRLGQDPEMRHTTSGTPVTNFSLATNEKWKNLNGNGIWKMDGIEWGMRNGKCIHLIGKWKMEMDAFQWKWEMEMDAFKWEMENGKGIHLNGEWKMENECI